MKIIINNLFWGLLICLFAQGMGYAQDSGVGKKKQSIQSEIDTIVQSAMLSYEIPGLSLGIVHRDSIVYTQGYGMTSMRNGSPITEDTIFHTASISKLFTAQAIMQLVNTHNLNLDDYIICLLYTSPSPRDRG